MTPTFIELPERKLVGLGARFITIMSPDKTNASVIPNLWHQFVQRQAEITNQVVGASYGLVEMLPASENPQKGEMFYIAGMEVPDLSVVPAGMLSRTIPAGRYAKFTHKGKLDGLGKTMGYIFGVWMPSGAAQRRSGPEIEVYDKRFIINSDASEFDILIPVK